MHTTSFDHTDRAAMGIALSSENAGEQWKMDALRFVRWYLQTHPTLFVDDLWSAGLQEPSSPRALGAVLQHAARDNWMSEQVDEEGHILAHRSTRSNGQLKRVWKSEIFVNN